MKFIGALVTAFFMLGVSTVFADTQTVGYDTVYDNADGSLTTVACSNGPNGLMTRGYSTFGSLPSWPNVAAAFAVESWNSPNCGTCWQLTYTDAQGTPMTLNVTAIDVATSGFVLGLNAMNALTDGQAVQLGRVDVNAVQVPSSACGL